MHSSSRRAGVESERDPTKAAGHPTEMQRSSPRACASCGPRCSATLMRRRLRRAGGRCVQSFVEFQNNETTQTSFQSIAANTCIITVLRILLSSVAPATGWLASPPPATLRPGHAARARVASGVARRPGEAGELRRRRAGRGAAGGARGGELPPRGRPPQRVLPEIQIPLSAALS